MKDRKEGRADELVTDEAIPLPEDTPIAERSGALVTGNSEVWAGAGHDAIAAEAYSLWMARGCHEGGDLEDWLEAERRVNGAGRNGDADARSR